MGRDCVCVDVLCACFYKSNIWLGKIEKHQMWPIMQNETLLITKNHNTEHTASPFSPLGPSGPCEGQTPGISCPLYPQLCLLHKIKCSGNYIIMLMP